MALEHTHACVDTVVLPEWLPLQVLVQAQVGHGGNYEADEQHDKVPGCTQQLWRAFNSKLFCSVPQAHHDTQTDCHKIYGGPLHIAWQAQQHVTWHTKGEHRLNAIRQELGDSLEKAMACQAQRAAWSQSPCCSSCTWLIGMICKLMQLLPVGQQLQPSLQASKLHIKERSAPHAVLSPITTCKSNMLSAQHQHVIAEATIPLSDCPVAQVCLPCRHVGQNLHGSGRHQQVCN